MRLISRSRDSAQTTQIPAFSIRHLVWLFSCSHPGADAIEYPTHSGATTECFCGLSVASVPTAQGCITKMTNTAYSATHIEQRKSKPFL